MGTPLFAVPSLRALIARDHEIIGVITQPDRPKGRGGRLTASPVKETAETHGLPVFQPEKVRRPDVIERVQALHPELIVVVAFGQILPGNLLHIPERGCINVHASLLPRYRGGAPVARALLEGEEETGITTLFMDEGMDTGPVLLQEKTPIRPGETAGSLGERLSYLGAEVLIKTLDRLVAGTLQAVPQDPTLASYAPLLKKEDGRIDWSREAISIERQIRAMDPWPGTYTYYEGRQWRIWEVMADPDRQGEASAGTIVRAEAGCLEVACGKGYIRIMSLQPVNRRRMSVGAFLAGHPVKSGTILSASGGEQT